MPDAVFLPRDDRWEPTELARGPWDPASQHGSAPAALLARELERLEPGSGMQVVRLTFEFLRPVPLAPLTVRARHERRGRRVQFISASLRAGETEVCRAGAVRVRRAGPGGPGGPPEDPPPGPGSGRPAGPPPHERLPSFAAGAVEQRWIRGDYGPGPATVWMRLRHPVVAGEQPTPLQRLVAAADFANGVGAALPWDSHLFVNADLTVYVERPPEGEWIRLDARTRLSGAGAGVAEAILHDTRGRVGRASQALLVDRR